MFVVPDVKLLGYEVTLTINLSRPINGSKKSPTCTVPAEHSNARQQADEILNKKDNINEG